MKHYSTLDELAQESARALKVSYLTNAGHLMLVFRECTCEDGCDTADFAFGWCEHGHRGEMEPVGAIRVLDQHDQALRMFHRTAVSAHEFMVSLNGAGIRHEDGRLPHVSAGAAA